MLMTLCGPFGTNLEILGVLNASFPPIFRNIGGATAPPTPPVPPLLNWLSFSLMLIENNTADERISFLRSSQVWKTPIR